MIAARVGRTIRGVCSYCRVSTGGQVRCILLNGFACEMNCHSLDDLFLITVLLIWRYDTVVERIDSAVFVVLVKVVRINDACKPSTDKKV